LIVENVSEAKAVMAADYRALVVLTQTTLSVDAPEKSSKYSKQRFPKMITPAKEDLCYATANRQDAVKELTKKVDIVLVIRFEEQ